MSFTFAGWSSGPSHIRSPIINYLVTEVLSWALVPLQRQPKHLAAAYSSWFCQKLRHPSLIPDAYSQRLPWGFNPLQRFPTWSSGMKWLSLACSIACTFRLSQPLGAFIRPKPADLVSCRIRSWGHPSELSSFRAAPRRFQRRYPLDVSYVYRVLIHAKVRH